LRRRSSRARARCPRPSSCCSTRRRARRRRAALDELRAHYDHPDDGHAVELVEQGGGWQILTRAEYAEAIERAQLAERPARLSAAALETLAVIAYRQPIGRAEVEEIRGVSVGGVLKTLLERGLVDVIGRSEGLGRPLLYGPRRSSSSSSRCATWPSCRAPTSSRSRCAPTPLPTERCRPATTDPDARRPPAARRPAARRPSARRVRRSATTRVRPRATAPAWPSARPGRARRGR
jgi:hypothetical protein